LELDGEALLLELLVREVPRLRRTAVADAVEAAELPLDLRGRLPEPHASECADGYEDPVLRKCGCERDGCEREHMLGSMASFERIAGLQLEVDGYDVERREVAVSPEFSRVTTTVVLHGRGERGEGEDVTYTPADHDGFSADLPRPPTRLQGVLHGTTGGRRAGSASVPHRRRALP